MSEEVKITHIENGLLLKNIEITSNDSEFKRKLSSTDMAYAAIIQLESKIDEQKKKLEKSEPAAFMFESDLDKFQRNETSATAYSIEMISPTENPTVPLYRLTHIGDNTMSEVNQGQIDILSGMVANGITENASLQAEIDRLMLEFCPDEMTKEQMENWEKHQKVSDISIDRLTPSE